MKNLVPQNTSTMTDSLEALKKVDLKEKLFGSGCIVTLTNIDGKRIIAPTCISGEYMAKVQSELKEALVNTLMDRQVALEYELNQVRSILQ